MKEIFFIIIFITIWYMAQFIIGFAAGVYIGTHYNCKPGLSFASQTFEQYCPKRLEGDDNYTQIEGDNNFEMDTTNTTTNNTKNTIKEKKAEEKVKEKAIELTSALKKWF